MDQHIYDEHDEREPDCHYQAVLDAWTAALAGITVTTPAPPAAVYDVPEIAIIMEGGLVQNIVARNDAPVIRSEEHTSELQSLMRTSYAVFCLKNKNTYKHNTTPHKY